MVKAGEEVLGGRWLSQGVCGASEVEFWEKAAADPKGPKRQEKQTELGKTGDPGSDRKGDRKGAQEIRTKERRNCGGGSRPWKRRGEGEASTER